MTTLTHKAGPVAAAAADLTQFARCVFEPTDIVEVRILPAKRSFWNTAKNLPQIARRLLKLNGGGNNIYIGGNPRRSNGGTKAEDVLLARCLFADIDGGTTVDEARIRWEAAGLPEPTLILHSGHGVHCWWRLTEPLADMAEWTSLQKAIIAAVGGDPVIHDPPRIMRLPGFYNYKADESPVPCSIVKSDPERCYPLAGLHAILAKHRAAQNGSHGATKSTAHKLTNGSNRELILKRAMQYCANISGVAKGRRNHVTFSAAGHLAAFTNEIGDKLTEAEIRDLVRTLNLKHNPPLPEAELCEVVASAMVNGTPRGDRVVKALRGARPRVSGQAEADYELPVPVGIRALIAGHPHQAEPIIDGLLRRGETANIIAAPKVGKSWLTYGLALSVAAGESWLGTYHCARGRVLLIDNELMPANIANRILTVANAMEIRPSAPSGLDFGVELFEFDAGVFELEVPVDAALFGVGFF